MEKGAYVYFMANDYNNVIYAGITGNLEQRVLEHKSDINADSFTAKYKCHKLVYYEHVDDIKMAIVREKQLKNWKREWKNELIESQNPDWEDLSLEWSGDCRL
ncbi:MAG: GIY-YIG nuclease family protein [Defluviitaleaceae bacterium]|nr:GIY-YIG nuclease family protein [Defluviitaleaceae bacterium]